MIVQLMEPSPNLHLRYHIATYYNLLQFGLKYGSLRETKERKREIALSFILLPYFKNIFALIHA